MITYQITVLCGCSLLLFFLKLLFCSRFLRRVFPFLIMGWKILTISIVTRTLRVSVCVLSEKKVMTKKKKQEEENHHQI